MANMPETLGQPEIVVSVGRPLDAIVKAGADGRGSWDQFKAAVIAIGWSHGSGGTTTGPPSYLVVSPDRAADRAFWVSDDYIEGLDVLGGV